MTRDEIRLIVFVLMAFAVGTGVQWWIKRDPAQPATAPPQRKTGWAEPPYVFKSRAEVDRQRQLAEGSKGPP
jgi:hypothetical protein